MPKKTWECEHEGHKIRVENHWRVLPFPFARERLYIDDRLADENEGMLRVSAKLSATLKTANGDRLPVKAHLGQGFLGLTVQCKVWVDSDLVLPSTNL